MPDIRIVPGNAIMSFTSSLNYIERITQDPSGSLTLYGSGSTGRTELFSIDGNNGRLFSVSDDLSDSLFSVNTIAGLPVIEAFADNSVNIGQYSAPPIKVIGSSASITGSLNGGADFSRTSLVYNETTNATRYLVFAPNGNGTPQTLYTNLGNLTYNPSSNTLTAGTFSGALSGNASTATALTSMNISQFTNNSGYTTNTGTVTSIATNNGVTGGTIISTGTIGLATAYGDTINPYASKTANTFLAAPNGSNGVPSFRAIAAADVPTLNQNTTGTATNATNAANIAVTDTTTTNATHYVSFTTGTSGNQVLRVDSNTLTFNPNTNIFTVPTVNSTTAVQGGNGSAGTPAFSFSGDTNTGMYNAGADTLGFSTGGTARMSILSSGPVQAVTDFRAPIFYDTADTSYYVDPASTSRLSTITLVNTINGGNGTATNPVFSFSGDTNTGMYNPTGTDTLGFSTAGTLRMRIDSSGNVGIGEPTIQGRFHVFQTSTLGGTTGNNLILQSLQNTGGSGGNNVYIKDYSLRDATGTTWTTWRHHNSIDIDGSHNTPGTNTKAFYERDPLSGLHEFGQEATYAVTIDGVNSRIGVATRTPSYPLHVNTNVSSISIYASADIVAYSDESVKGNIRPIENVIERIEQSRGVLYDRTDIEAKDNIGFIAQELEVAFPELVVTNEDGTKAVKYQNTVAVLFEAIKEQQKQINELKSKI
jgi:hypothetical protein